MVKIPLYNSGELKEVVFIIIFYTSFVLTVCIPNISKEPKEDVYLEYSVSKLCILPLRVQTFNASYTPPTGKDIQSVSSSNLQRYPFSHIASILYMNQSMMASPCKLNKNIFYVHVYKRNKNAIIYIYIIYRNMKRIISKFLNIIYFLKSS